MDAVPPPSMASAEKDEFRFSADAAGDSDSDIEDDWCFVSLYGTVENEHVSEQEDIREVTHSVANCISKELLCNPEDELLSETVDEIFKNFEEVAVVDVNPLLQFWTAWRNREYERYQQRKNSSIRTRSSVTYEHVNNNIIIALMVDLLRVSPEPVNIHLLWLKILTHFIFESGTAGDSLQVLLDLKVAATVLGTMSAYRRSADIQKYGCSALAVFAPIRPTPKIKAPLRESAIQVLTESLANHKDNIDVVRDACGVISTVAEVMVRLPSYCLEQGYTSEETEQLCQSAEDILDCIRDAVMHRLEDLSVQYSGTEDIEVSIKKLMACFGCYSSNRRSPERVGVFRPKSHSQPALLKRVSFAGELEVIPGSSPACTLSLSRGEAFHSFKSEMEGEERETLGKDSSTEPEEVEKSICASKGKNIIESADGSEEESSIDEETSSSSDDEYRIDDGHKSTNKEQPKNQNEETLAHYEEIPYRELQISSEQGSFSYEEEQDANKRESGSHASSEEALYDEPPMPHDVQQAPQQVGIEEQQIFDEERSQEYGGQKVLSPDGQQMTYDKQGTFHRLNDKYDQEQMCHEKRAALEQDFEDEYSYYENVDSLQVQEQLRSMKVQQLSSQAVLEENMRAFHEQQAFYENTPNLRGNRHHLGSVEQSFEGIDSPYHVNGAKQFHNFEDEQVIFDEDGQVLCADPSKEYELPSHERDSFIDSEFIHDGNERDQYHGIREEQVVFDDSGEVLREQPYESDESNSYLEEQHSTGDSQPFSEHENDNFQHFHEERDIFYENLQISRETHDSQEGYAVSKEQHLPNGSRTEDLQALYDQRALFEENVQLLSKNSYRFDRQQEFDVSHEQALNRGADEQDAEFYEEQELQHGNHYEGETFPEAHYLQHSSEFPEEDYESREGSFDGYFEESGGHRSIRSSDECLRESDQFVTEDYEETNDRYITDMVDNSSSNQEELYAEQDPETLGVQANHRECPEHDSSQNGDLSLQDVIDQVAENWKRSDIESKFEKEYRVLSEYDIVEALVNAGLLNENESSPKIPKFPLEDMSQGSEPDSGSNNFHESDQSAREGAKEAPDRKGGGLEEGSSSPKSTRVRSLYENTEEEAEDLDIKEGLKGQQQASFDSGLDDQYEPPGEEDRKPDGLKDDTFEWGSCRRSDRQFIDECVRMSRLSILTEDIEEAKWYENEAFSTTIAGEFAEEQTDASGSLLDSTSGEEPSSSDLEVHSSHATELSRTESTASFRSSYSSGSYKLPQQNKFGECRSMGSLDKLCHPGGAQSDRGAKKKNRGDVLKTMSCSNVGVLSPPPKPKRSWYYRSSDDVRRSLARSAKPCYDGFDNPIYDQPPDLYTSVSKPVKRRQKEPTYAKVQKKHLTPSSSEVGTAAGVFKSGTSSSVDSGVELLRANKKRRKSSHLYEDIGLLLGKPRENSDSLARYLEEDGSEATYEVCTLWVNGKYSEALDTFNHLTQRLVSLYSIVPEARKEENRRSQQLYDLEDLEDDYPAWANILNVLALEEGKWTLSLMVRFLPIADRLFQVEDKNVLNAVIEVMKVLIRRYGGHILKNRNPSLFKTKFREDCREGFMWLGKLHLRTEFLLTKKREGESPGNLLHSSLLDSFAESLHPFSNTQAN